MNRIMSFLSRCSVYIILPIFSFSAIPAFASKNEISLDNLKYVRVILKVLDIEGNPIPHASILSYCPQYGLFYPRFTHDQYERPWINPPSAYTDKNGLITIHIPQGKWNFLSVGHLSNLESTKCGIVCSVKRNIPISSECEIELKPDDSAVIPSVTLNDSRIDAVYIKSHLMGVWTHMNIGEKIRKYGNQIFYNQKENIQIMTVLHSDHEIRYTRFPLPCSDDVLKRAFDINSMLHLRFVQDESLPLSKNVKMYWAAEEPGLEGEMNTLVNKDIYFTPNTYYLIYSKKVNDELTLRFGPVTIRSKENLLKVGDGFKSKILEYQNDPKSQNSLIDFTGMLLVQDRNNMIAWDWQNNYGRFPQLNGSVCFLKGKIFHCQQRGLVFSTKLKREDANLKSGKQWKIETGCKNIGGLFLPMEKKEIKSTYFYGSYWKDIEGPVRNFLRKGDSIRIKLARISQRSPKCKTHLILGPNSGYWATHNGKLMSVNCSILGLLVPYIQHGFCHEMTHTFGYRHGPLMELIVELVRSCPESQNTAQLVKWMFFDRINKRSVARNIPKRFLDYERDGFLGLYFYFYNMGGPKFISFMSENEFPLLEIAKQKKIPVAAMRAALCSRALGKDVNNIWNAYGCTINDTQYKRAEILITDYLKNKKRK